jgi:two-component system, cell cycle sensor histidine kinase and response regulator CckA
MDIPLRVLIVEESEDSALPLLRELDKGGYTVESARVETAEGMRLALRDRDWDVAIVRYRLGDFGALAALELIDNQQIDLPTIVISDTMGESAAVGVMNAGARDYIVRENLTRLVPAVEREVKEAKQRQQGLQLEEALRQSRAALQQQLAREHLVEDITDIIRRTLDLDTILQSAVDRVREFLEVDRTIVFRFQTDWQCQAIAESTTGNWRKILGSSIYDPCFEGRYIEPYMQGRVGAIADIHTAGMAPCHVELLEQYQVKANLVVPILLLGGTQAGGTPARFHPQQEELWGLLIAHQCSSPRQWYREEMSLLKQLADSLGIAIQQSELYQQTRRELAERQRQNAKIHEQAVLLDISTDAICVRDLQHRILFWNRGAEILYGWKATEVLGKNAIELLHSTLERVPDLAAVQSKLLETGEWQGEIENVTKDARKMIVASRWNLMRDENMQPKSILTVSTDITAKKQVEVQLRRIQRLESLGTLAIGIAHDFNNILTPILAAAQLLSIRLPRLDARSQRMLSLIESSSKRGADLVKQIIAFARGIESERMTLQLADVLQEVLAFARQSKAENIEVEVNIDDRDLWLVAADATQLYQVFLNLCNNACSAMPNGGKLTVTTSNRSVDATHTEMNLDARVGAYVAVTIADSGVGIPPESIERIFEPFFTTKERSKGTGLGLSTVLGIIRNHGGFIEVNSQVGIGTSFTVFLPATSSNLSPLPTATIAIGNGG